MWLSYIKFLTSSSYFVQKLKNILILATFTKNMLNYQNNLILSCTTILFHIFGHFDFYLPFGGLIN